MAGLQATLPAITAAEGTVVAANNMVVDSRATRAAAAVLVRLWRSVLNMAFFPSVAAGAMCCGVMPGYLHGPCQLPKMAEIGANGTDARDIDVMNAQ